MKQCPICLTYYEKLDGHHIYPTAYGGPFNGPLLYLCSSCHQHIHDQADHVYAGNNKIAISAKNLNRAMKYVNYIVTARRNRDNGIFPIGTDLKVHEVSFRLSRQKLNALHSAKQRLGAKSIQALMESLVDTIIKNTHGGIGIKEDKPVKRANGIDSRKT